jgi:hypothetical protein
MFLNDAPSRSVERRSGIRPQIGVVRAVCSQKKAACRAHWRVQFRIERAICQARMGDLVEAQTTLVPSSHRVGPERDLG